MQNKHMSSFADRMHS